MTGKRVGGIILAAGKSSRMPVNKLLLPIAGYPTMLDAVIDHAIAAQLSPLIVVSGAKQQAIEAVAQGRGVECVNNPHYETGQSSSLQAGLMALPADTAALILLADQPFITCEIMTSLIAAYQEHEVAAVAPLGANGARGNPVLFAPALFDELMRVSGDSGGRQVLERHWQEVLFLQLGGTAVLTDIDTEEQYQAYRDGLE
jgi:molybdenum cofactor cytidylyltransferase